MRTFEEIVAEIATASGNSDPDALRILAAQLMVLGTRRAEARAKSALGTAAGLSGDYPSSLEHYRHAQAILEELGDRLGLASIAANLGNVYRHLGENAKALEHYQRALAVFEEEGNRSLIATALGNIGIVYNTTGDYPSALTYYQRACALHEELDDRASIARVTGNIGNVYRDIGDHATALEHVERSAVLYEQIGHTVGFALAACSMGNICHSSGDHRSALHHYRRGLDMYEQMGGHPNVPLFVGALITTLLDVHEIDEAKRLLDQQVTMSLISPDARSTHFANRARIAEYEHDLDLANDHLRAGLEISEAAGLRDRSAAFHKQLRDLAQKRNDFAAYIEHNNEYQRITEEISGKEATQKLAMMEAERTMEAERREREKERALLFGALPKSVADRMIRGEDVTGDHFDHAAVMFLDIVGFTSNTSHMPPTDVVKMLENIFKSIDAICEQHNVIKIKTIGDSYMCLAHEGNGELGMGNGSEQRTASPEQRVAAVALAILQSEFYWPHKDLHEDLHEDSLDRLEFRIGIHSGPATAGVIGTQRLQYDVWGDTVNVASRLESTSEPGRIHVSEAFASCLDLRPRNDSSSPSGEETKDVIPNASEEWHVALRGETEIKGKGLMTTYWLQATEQVDDDH